MDRSTGSWGRAVVDGPVIRTEGATQANLTAVVSGLLTYNGKYVGLDGHPAVWPQGTAWDLDGQRLRLASGETVGLGERVTGSGGYISVDGVRALFGDVVAETCGEVDEVRVFNPGQPIAAG